MQALETNFTYDVSAIELLKHSISAERIAPYLLLANNDERYAIALYEWNTKVSEAMYGVHQGLEVTLRNAFHEVLSTAYKRDDWYEVAPLEGEQRNQIKAAKERIEADRRMVTPGRMVAELMFGFWTSLVGTVYAQKLWDKHLYKAFPKARVSRKQVAQRLKKIRFLRNRVAHHECIIGKVNLERNLRQDCQEILECLGWICDTTALWVAHTNSFDKHYAARPRDPDMQLTLVTRLGIPAIPIVIELAAEANDGLQKKV